jgi:rhodanese-related sulfurtransferase
MREQRRPTKSALLLAVTLVAAIGIAAFYYIIDIRETLELVKSERSGNSELGEVIGNDVTVEVVPFAAVAAAADEYAFIDVREKEEFAQGRIKGALHYRLGDLLNEQSVREEMLQQTAGRKRAFFCHDGKRSYLAAQSILQEYGGVNIVLEKGFQQIRNTPEYQHLWEGSLKHVLPQDDSRDRTPWIKRRNVTVNTLIDLSLVRHETVARLEGKNFRHAPLVLMSNRQIDDFISTLGDEPIVALCDSKVSCFYTRIFRYRLEERGLQLAGFVRVKERTPEQTAETAR